MDCLGCQTFQYGPFSCSTCLQKEAKSTFINHEIKIWSDRIKQQWPKEKHEFQAEISKLKTSIDSVDTLARQLPSAILQAKERIKHLKNQNEKRKDKLKSKKEKFDSANPKSNFEHIEQDVIFERRQRNLGDSLRKTRLAILNSLGQISQALLSLDIKNANDALEAKKETRNSLNLQKSNFPPRAQTLTPLAKNIGNLSQELSSQQAYRMGKQQSIREKVTVNSKSASNRINSTVATNFIGGASHVIKITALISRYLGLSIPFDLEMRTSMDSSISVHMNHPTLYIKHDYSEYQAICKRPLYELEIDPEERVLLLAIANYNISYLQHNQNLSTSLENIIAKPDAHQKINQLSLGPNGLLKLFKSYKEAYKPIENDKGNNFNKPVLSPIYIKESTNQGLDSTFTLEFRQVLTKILSTSSFSGSSATISLTSTPGSSHPHNLYDDHFGSSLGTGKCTSTNNDLDDDYDLDFSLVHFTAENNSTTKGVPSIRLQKEESEDLWDSVDFMLPPTPAEMAAAGL